MKKIVILFLSVFEFAVLTACNFQITNNEVLASNEDIYLFSAVSSTSLLPTNSTPTQVSMKLSDTDETLVENEVEDINKYLQMMEQFLGENNGLSTEIVESDRAEYQNKVVFTTVDLLGNQIVYVLYYNEEILTEDNDIDNPEEVITTDMTTEENEEEDVSESTEKEEISDNQETRISGILIMNGNEYQVLGKKEIEEDESKIKMISYLDDNNYVTVVSKVEDNERKYQYEVVTDGVVTMKSKVKFEEEDNETKFVLDYTDGDLSGFFEFKREIEDDKDIIKIKYEINQGSESESGEVKILVVTDPITGDTTYQYVIKAEGHQEKEINHDRRDKHDDEDDEIEDTSL